MWHHWRKEEKEKPVVVISSQITSAEIAYSAIANQLAKHSLVDELCQFEDLIDQVRGELSLGDVLAAALEVCTLRKSD